MATPAPSANPSVVTVERGDTLWGIASAYLGSGTKYKELAHLNNILDPNFIYVGQKITLTGGGSSSTSKSTTSTKTKIVAFGLSAANTSSDTLFAVWETSRNKDEVENFKYEWQYTTGDKASGNDVWYKGTNGGSTSDVYETNSTFGIPAGAQKIKFRVKPVSKKKKDSDGKDVGEYFTDAEWVSSSIYYAKDVPPETPGTIKTTIDHNTMKLKVEISDYPVEEYKENGTFNELKATIQVIINDKKEHAFNAGLKFNDYGYVSAEFNVSEGNRYKVRCRTTRGKFISEWSSYTENKYSIPAAPTNLRITPSKKVADNTFDVYLEWDKSNTAETYTIQYVGVEPGVTPNFDALNSDGISSVTTTDDTTNCTLNNIDKGFEYYFRICANHTDAGSSKWSEVSEKVVIGTPPGPPTTWSSSTSVAIGEPLYLYWVHNPTDGSSETFANVYIEFYKGDEFKPIHVIDRIQEKSQDYDEKDKTGVYVFDTNLETNPYLEEGVKLRWRIRTAGVTGEFGNDPSKNWSVVREIDVYAPPELTFTVQPHNDIAHISDFVCTSFPLSVYAFAGPSTQTPRSYYISITSNDIYETVDNVGNDKTVSAGELIYSKYVDNETLVDYDISAGDVNLDNGMSYKIECVVSMSSGLTAKHSMNFTVNWSDESYEPWAEVAFDPETLVASIHPYCEEYTTHYYKVVQSGANYTATDEPIAVAWGELATTENGEPIYTSTGERVYSGITTDSDGNFLDDEFYYYEAKTGALIEGITLSVYRREFDGRFTEIATGIDNTKNTFVTDPHPALDFARYRIVAVVNDTGAVSYTDLPGIPVGENGIILQWNEDWSSFDVDPDVTDSLSRPNWAGSLLRLPYNVDVSPSYGIDTTLIEYAGRQHPVSYYGTQLGESATWSTVIPKSDKETIYALHRLAKWTGNVYAREPSGMGYWANITVQFPQKHLDKTIPVSLTLTRVEGGM